MIEKELRVEAHTTVIVRGPDGKIKHQQTVKAELLPAFFNWLKGVMKDGNSNNGG